MLALATRNLHESEFTLQRRSGVVLLTLQSRDGMNRLSRMKVGALCDEIEGIIRSDGSAPALVISGLPNFSAGADLNEIAQLSGPQALAFAQAGQELMNLIDEYPAPVFAAISGYCMGGGLDVALACDRRIAAPNAIFGHRGAALGLITGWGGTQRLPRLVGMGRALEMLVVAEKLHAQEALRIGLVDAVVNDPLAHVIAPL